MRKSLNDRKKDAGQDYRATSDKPASVLDNSYEADCERRKCKASLKYLYQNYLVKDVCDKVSGKKYRAMWSSIHDLMADFLEFDKLGALVKERLDAKLNYEYLDPMRLNDYVPPRDKDGNYRERWLYWPMLNQEPEIQDGAEGPISKMFHESFWHGVIIRIAGDGSTKCMLVSRGHLKSDIATQGYMTWKIIRDPSDRHMVRSNTAGNAVKMLGDVKTQFENNEAFRKLYGNLGPPAKSERIPWTEDCIQVLIPARERRGRDPTLSANGIDSELTGVHVDDIFLDDVVGETNVDTAEQIAKVRNKVKNLEGVRDPGTPLTDIGTRWERDDAHGQYINAEAPAFCDTSFMVGTLLDNDQSERWPLEVTPLGYGKPIWPERWTRKEILKKHRLWDNPRRWFGQMFNQFHGTTALIFRKEWLRYYANTGPNQHGTYLGWMPEDVAKKEKLNIFIGIDTASGKEKQEGKLDHTAIVVLGQNPNDRRRFFLLDGLKEKLTAELIAMATVDMAEKWRAVANGYGGTMRVGVEETSYINFMPLAVRDEIRRRGSKAYFELEKMSHQNKSKPERIKTLTTPYGNHCVFWPETIIRQPIPRLDPRTNKPLPSDAEPYDFVKMLMDEMVNYTPQATRDDALDGHVYAYLLADPPDYAQESESERVQHPRGYDSRIRDTEMSGQNAPQYAGYDAPGQWRPNL